MKTSVHFLVSLFVAALLYPLFGFNSFLVIITGVLIDTDHYIWFLFVKKKLSLVKCHHFFMVESAKLNWRNLDGILLVFHSIEMLILFVVLAFFNEIVLILAIGLLFHYLLDLVWYYIGPKRFVVNHSIINWIVRNKNSRK